MDFHHHRPIELQSSEDLAYLLTNARAAVDAHLNAAFPAIPGPNGEPDEMRAEIEQRVDDYLVRTFDLAAPNLTINGMPVPPAPIDGPAPAYEAFDARARQRLAALATEEEDLLREIAQLKRSVPPRAAIAHAAHAAHADAAAAATLRAALAAAESAGPVAVDAQLAAAPAAAARERERVREPLAHAVAVLDALARDMPALVARMEQARVAAEYVVRDRRSN